MRSFIVTVAFAVAALAAPSTRSVNVQLEAVDNSNIKAIVTNNGPNDIKFVTTGSLLGKAPSPKVKAFSNGKALDFGGVYVHIGSKLLQGTNTMTLRSGQSTESTFDAAHLYDLSKGGEYDFVASGVLRTVDEEGDLTGQISYESEKLQTTIDGKKAADARAKAHERRTVTQSDCTGSNHIDQNIALANCRTMATYARDQARSGDAGRMNEYFKRSDQNTRNTVADVFQKVLDNCAYANQGFSTMYCTDVHGGCTGAIALTYPATSEMVLCHGFFDAQDELTDRCHTGDRASVLVHESTHLREVKGTSDLAYGYDDSRRLSADDELKNADSYTYFAHSFYEGCYGANLYSVRGWVDADFQGNSANIVGPQGVCGNLPDLFNDKFSSFQGWGNGDCQAFKDGGCTGASITIPRGQGIGVSAEFNDVISSIRC